MLLATGAISVQAGGAANSICFGSTVDGAQDLTVTSPGPGRSPHGIVGGLTQLSSLTVNSTNAGAAAISLQSVTTTTTQSYAAPITLEANTVLTGTTGTFSGLITGAGFDLTLTFSVTTLITGSSLSGVGNLTSNGPIQLSGTITTTGSQTYNSTVQLVGNTILNATAVSFGSTLDGNAAGRQLTVAVGTGSASFSNTVGALNPLGATSITADTISFNGGANSVHGSSTLLLQPATAGTTVSVGGAGSTLVITAADIAALASGFTQVQIGRSAGRPQ